MNRLLRSAVQRLVDVKISVRPYNKVYRSIRDLVEDTIWNSIWNSIRNFIPVSSLNSVHLNATKNQKKLIIKELIK